MRTSCLAALILSAALFGCAKDDSSPIPTPVWDSVSSGSNYNYDDLDWQACIGNPTVSQCMLESFADRLVIYYGVVKSDVISYCSVISCPDGQYQDLERYVISH